MSVVRLKASLKVPMLLFPCGLPIQEKKVLSNLTIYPWKIRIWQRCFNCPACEPQRESVFIKTVSTVWTERWGIRRLKSAFAPDSFITPIEWPRCLKNRLNDFHTHIYIYIICEIKQPSTVELLRWQCERWTHSPLDYQTDSLSQLWICHLQAFPQRPHKLLVCLLKESMSRAVISEYICVYF